MRKSPYAAMRILGVSVGMLLLSACQLAPSTESAPTTAYPLDPAIDGRRPAKALLDCLTPVQVEYVDFDGARRDGVIIVNRDFAEGVRQIFAALADLEFPIERIEPVSAYGWDDERSMQANNTSGYNYRNVTGAGRLSAHAIGCAIDVNPRYNPYVFPADDVLDSLVQQGKADADGEVFPEYRSEAFHFREDGALDLTRVGAIHPRNGSYTRDYAAQPGTVIAGTPLGDAVIDIFAEHGWTVWGGAWNSVRDWQHFQVPGCLRKAQLAPGERYCEP
ncbi:MAG: M15 family metallopeptidase [Pseudomonadota bacterium]